MKTVEVVATLAGLTAEQVNTIVDVVNHTRAANEALAGLEPKKRRGRKPGVKNAVKAPAKAAPAPAKKSAAKKIGGKKSSIPDSFTE